jgi:hypothetical protein
MIGCLACVFGVPRGDGKNLCAYLYCNSSNESYQELISNFKWLIARGNISQALQKNQIVHQAVILGPQRAQFETTILLDQLSLLMQIEHLNIRFKFILTLGL